MDFSLNLTEHHTPTAKFDIIVCYVIFSGYRSYKSKFSVKQ